ncbi:MAG: type II toxin-antitoxin system RatA family toxin [Alphaproteobacteria bacterium]|nr:MAG: type II toxin-antitoxin system RatA family toxin [Alphaproteobacteria bacterium]
MPKFSDSKILPYTQKQMFDLVAKVEEYPNFLPWCLDAVVTHRTETQVAADLVIGWKLIREKFTSHVHLQAPAAITVEYQDGPFQYLHNEWRFTAQGKKQTEIDFMVDFEFRSPLMNTIMGPLFIPAVHKMIEAFEKRAEDLYGQ